MHDICIISAARVQKAFVITGGHTIIGFELCKTILNDGDAWSDATLPKPAALKSSRHYQMLLAL